MIYSSKCNNPSKVKKMILCLRCEKVEIEEGKRFADICSKCYQEMKIPQ